MSIKTELIIENFNFDCTINSYNRNGLSTIKGEGRSCQVAFELLGNIYSTNLGEILVSDVNSESNNGGFYTKIKFIVNEPSYILISLLK